MLTDDLLKRIDEKLDALRQDFNDYRVSVEGRLTKVEVRSSIFGAISGAIMGALSYFVGPRH